MDLIDQLQADMKTAMKAKDKDTLNVIRLIRAAVKNAEIERGTQLSEDELMDVFTKELKQRNDSLHEFSKAGRDDLVAKTEREIAVIKRYLPEPLTEEELQQVVKDAIQSIGASSKADMGKVMAHVMPKVKGRADGKAVNRLVQQALNQ